MCDTIVATAQATRDGVLLFGKNSDREPNEAQYLEITLAADHVLGSQLQCTYIAIPQVSHTHSVLLSRPFWIWGAEMGVNEHGVAIGNEAIFSRLPAAREKRLIGMDLLRLGLERAGTAAQALQVITELLEMYGQGGNCGFEHPLYYHNSFLIADPKEAWVLETVDRHWAAKHVNGVYSISNCLTIGQDWDLSSPDLVHFAVDKGWCKDRASFDFARDYSDTLFTHFSDSRARCRRSSVLLTSNQGKIDVAVMMSVLRDHGQSAGSDWRPDYGISGADICMHSSYGPIRGSQSTASLVSYLDVSNPLHFATGTSAPCTSIFKPVWLDGPVPGGEIPPTGEYDAHTRFWRHERLHRATLQDYTQYIHYYQSDRDQLESQFIKEAFAAREKSAAERSQVSTRCFEEAEAAEAQWLERVTAQPPKKIPGYFYRSYWQGNNRRAKMP